MGQGLVCRAHGQPVMMAHVVQSMSSHGQSDYREPAQGQWSPKARFNPHQLPTTIKETWDYPTSKPEGLGDLAQLGSRAQHKGTHIKGAPMAKQRRSAQMSSCESEPCSPRAMRGADRAMEG